MSTTGMNRFEPYGPPARGAVDRLLTAADRVANAHRSLDAIRKLHHIITAPGGLRFCEHCCLNKVGQRRFACHDNHTHQLGDAPCPTLAILGDAA